MMIIIPAFPFHFKYSCSLSGGVFELMVFDTIVFFQRFFDTFFFGRKVFGSWDLAQGFGKFCLLPLIAAMESTFENYPMGFFGKLSYGLYAKLILYVL